MKGARTRPEAAQTASIRAASREGKCKPTQTAAASKSKESGTVGEHLLLTHSSPILNLSPGKW